MAPLTPSAREVLQDARARRLSYRISVLRSPERKDGGRTVLVLAGEAHLKFPQAWNIGVRLVDAFPLRGVEGLPFRRVFLGFLCWLIVVPPRLVLRALTLGQLKGSTIHYANQAAEGKTVRVEESSPVPFPVHLASAYLSALPVLLVLQLILPFGWPTLALALWELHLFVTCVPAFLLREKPWVHFVNPAFGILGARNQTMVRGLAELVAAETEETCLAVMGRAHVSGCERLLIEEHGFERVR